MAEYMICKISSKNKLEIVDIVDRDKYEQLAKAVILAKQMEVLFAKKAGTVTYRDVGKINLKGRELAFLYPYMDYRSLLTKYRKTIVLSHFKLLQ